MVFGNMMMKYKQIGKRGNVNRNKNTIETCEYSVSDLMMKSKQAW
jgi:hypothetical protein